MTDAEFDYQLAQVRLQTQAMKEQVIAKTEELRARLMMLVIAHGYERALFQPVGPFLEEEPAIPPQFRIINPSRPNSSGTKPRSRKSPCGSPTAG